MQFLIDVGLILIYGGAVLLLFAWCWKFWEMYAHQNHVNNINWVILEIKLPREILKSPLAMETALGALIQTSSISVWYKKFILGNYPAWSSLEIASIEGTIHFYIRVHRKLRPLVEGAMYAQYPGIEIVEAEDYTKVLQYSHLKKDVKAWGGYYGLSEKWQTGDMKDGKPYSMPAHFLPIKTYVDYGLDKDPDEEVKVDPLSSVLEIMGAAGKGEHMWYQVLVQAEAGFNNTNRYPGTYVNEVTHQHMTLDDMAEARKKQIYKYKKVKKGDLAYDQYGNPIQTTVPGADGKSEYKPLVYGEEREIRAREGELTADEKSEIEDIKRKMDKPIFRTVVRLMYVAKADKFKPEHIGDFFGMMKPFDFTNQFKPVPTDPYDFPWEDIGQKRTAWRTEEEFEEYVEREGFHPHAGNRDKISSWEDYFFYPYSTKTRKTFRMLYEILFHPFSHPPANKVICLNIEEVATLWHLPGATAGVPTLPRIDSTKGVAPVNLPR